MDISDTLETYRIYCKSNYAPNTVSIYVYAAKNFFDSTERRTLSSITPSDIEAWKVTLLKAGKHPVTVNNYLRQAKHVFTYAIDVLEYSGPNPFLRAKRVKVPRQVHRWLTIEEIDALLWSAAIHSTDMYLYCMLALYAGLRKQEVDAARWEWIDWERNRLCVAPNDHFLGKTSASVNEIPLHPRLRDVLEIFKKTSGYIVAPDKDYGQHRYRYEARKAFAAVCKFAQLEGVTPHKLRHTIASHLAQHGFSLSQIALYLRQSSARSAERYAHLSPDVLDVSGVL